MSLVENELTMQNVERARNNPEFKKYKEVEQKLTPKDPELLGALFKAEALPVEQIYLSSVHDEFSLRVRCIDKQTGPEYTATIKSRGEIVNNALERTEVETEISEGAFNYYKSLELPSVKKLRAQVMEGVTVDFYDDTNEPVLIEIEHADPEVRTHLTALMQEMTDGCLVDRSNDSRLNNESIAYRHYERSGNSEYLKKKPESLDAFSERVLGEMIATYVTGKNRVVVGLTGMSGSGKTTVTQTLQERIVELYGEAYKPIVISTDDYHFGKTHLETTYGAPYTEWDDSKTYDTEQLAIDLKMLENGLAINKRHFDFSTEEPVFEEEVENSPFIILEGLYAGSEHLDEVRDIHFELPTGLGTAVGRDVRRLSIDSRANRAFPDPPARLKYQIETAIPIYLEQAKPRRKPYSASVRALASRVFMLNELNKSI